MESPCFHGVEPERRVRSEYRSRRATLGARCPLSRDRERAVTRHSPYTEACFASGSIWAARRSRGSRSTAADEVARLRVDTPRDDYAATLDAIVSLVARLERSAGAAGTVGVGIPGTISP